MPRNDLIQLRSDTAANWTSTNPILAVGEMGFETDTNLFKIGDGSTLWTSLLYAVTPPQTFTYKVGDTGPGGGIIFFVDRYDEYAEFTYLEVAPVGTQVLRTWATNVNSNQSTAVSGADSKALGAGHQNTLDIVAQTGNTAATCAAVYCANLTSGGQSDWYLGSIAEMRMVYDIVGLQLGVGGFTFGDSVYYWSSTEYAANAAQFVYFSSGSQYWTNKSYTYYVRPVRRFSDNNEEVPPPPPPP
jgi:hypothetical protein